MEQSNAFTMTGNDEAITEIVMYIDSKMGWDLEYARYMKIHYFVNRDNPADCISITPSQVNIYIGGEHVSMSLKMFKIFYRTILREMINL